MSDVAERFQNLHEFIKVAKQNLNRNNFDYIVGATETETTLARNRASLDSIAFKPRILRNVQEVDTSTELYGRKIRIPVMIAPVGGLQLFWQGGAATVAAAAGEFLDLVQNLFGTVLAEVIGGLLTASGNAAHNRAGRRIGPVARHPVHRLGGHR